MRRPRPRTPRSASALLLVPAAAAVSLFAAACGTQKISVASTSDANRSGAVIFNQRCSGCHSLSAAATYGSAANVRTREYVNGPNFNVRCERPVARILYAIANGGFSGAIMPQNIVVGQDAVKVAEFVARYSGRAAPRVSGLTQCSQKAIGTIPNFNAAVNTIPEQTGPSNVKQGQTTATSTSSAATAPPSSTTALPGAAAKANSGKSGAAGKGRKGGKTKKSGGKSPG